MQWLVDLIMERIWAEINGFGIFVDRGDPGVADFRVHQFTKDNAWHDMDLSSIVPDKALAVLLRVTIATSATAGLIDFRKNGNVFPVNQATVGHEVANLQGFGDIVIALDENRIIEYKVKIQPTYHVLSTTVGGWWLGWP